MNIHEYQAKQLLARYGVPILKGGVAYTADEAAKVAAEIDGPAWVVKAQIHAGGRGKGRFQEPQAGKGGGVRVVRSSQAAGEAAGQMLGATLVTHQTGPRGRVVRRVFIEQGCKIARELYLSLLVDRAAGQVTVMASTEGGMNIEEVAAKTPEKIVQVGIDPALGVYPYHGRKVAKGLGLSGAVADAAVRMVRALYDAFLGSDASLIEINPLVLTADDQLIALDAKMTFDDNALARHKDIAELRDETEEDPAEREGAKHGLNYIALDGNIGCMVNGAGLAMATMDIIKAHGGDPANFLDVGGGATKDRVSAAFKLLLSDPKVEGILVNIFGGIMRCDVIAEGVVAAAREVRVNVPLVVRLEGTNVEAGKEILAKSGLPIISANDLDDAAAKVVNAVKEAA